MAVAAKILVAPFTVEHFREWASHLILDSGESFVPEPFQERFLADVFAGYNECWLIVPEENGKTTLVAALALYHAEHRAMASVPVAASSRDQTEILYGQAEGFVLRSDALHDTVYSDLQAIKGKLKTQVPRFVCLEGFRRIKHYRGGRIQVFSADDRTGDGPLPTLGILEELHRHRDMRLYRTWSGKLRKRDGQLVAISTAGEPGTEFENTRERIRQTAVEVTHDGGFTRYAVGGVVLHEYAVPEDGDVTDMALVKSANPFSGITEETLAAKYESPTMTLGHWKRFTCNVPTRGDNAAVTEAEWEAAKTRTTIPEGQTISLGIDPGWKWDTFAMVPLWMKARDFRLFGPATVLEPPRDGNALHPDTVMVALEEIHKRNPIETIVMDTSQSVDFAQRIETELGVPVVDRAQTNPRAAEDCANFMEALRSGWLKHGGDEAFTRHVLNAIARELPGGLRRFDRPMPGRGHDQVRRVIDALSAASMVHTFAISDVPEEPSSYEERGLVTL